MSILTLAVDVLALIVLGVVLFAGAYGLFVGVVETIWYFTGEKQ